jgi:hypothetical protein
MFPWITASVYALVNGPSIIIGSISIIIVASPLANDVAVSSSANDVVVTPSSTDDAVVATFSSNYALAAILNYDSSVKLNESWTIPIVLALHATAIIAILIVVNLAIIVTAVIIALVSST